MSLLLASTVLLRSQLHSGPNPHSPPLFLWKTPTRTSKGTLTTWNTQKPSRQRPDKEPLLWRFLLSLFFARRVHAPKLLTSRLQYLKAKYELSGDKCISDERLLPTAN